MAQSMFGSMYDAKKSGMDDLRDSAYKTGSLGGRGAIIEAATLGGGMLGRGASRAFGGLPQAEAKQAKIQELKQKFPNPVTYEDYMEISNEFMNSNLPDVGEKFFDMAQELKTSTSLSTSMKDKRDIAEFELMCDYSDPTKDKDGLTCAQRASARFVEIKRQTAGEKGEGEFRKGQSKILNAAETKIYDDADEANYQIASIDQSIKMMDDIYTGAGGDWLAYGKNLASSFGFAEADWAAGEEQFKVNTMKSVMAWVKQTKGAISEKEMKLFADASPGLSRTRAGNRLILNTMREAALYQRRLEDEYGIWAEENPKGGIRQWRAHKRNWNLTNGIKAPTSAEIQAALKPDSSVPAVSATSKPFTIEVVE
jgi:hypothetical protein